MTAQFLLRDLILMTFNQALTTYETSVSYAEGSTYISHLTFVTTLEGRYSYYSQFIDVSPEA